MRKMIITIVFLIVGGLFLLAAGRFVFFELLWSKRMMPTHVFQVVPKPAFLSDALALEKAKETLELDRLNPNDWVVNGDNRTFSPDGLQDKYLVRNALDPNSGSIMFWGPNHSRRSVDIELRGDKLFCRSVLLL